jgi:hypothetical protein
MDTHHSTPPDTTKQREVNFCVWLGQARAKDTFIYHRGFLALDTSDLSRRLPSADRLELCRLAKRARWAEEQGLVHLVQRRHGAGDFAYLAVARPKPKLRRSTLREKPLLAAQ